MRRFRKRHDPLEARLRQERPRPSDELVRGITSDVGAPPTRRSPRLGLALVMCMTVIFAFALTGGIGYAASAVSSGTSAVKKLLVTRTHVAAAQNAKNAAPRDRSAKPADDQYGEKVVICHIPPGNPGNLHTIIVSASAVPAHLAHGDYLGPCRTAKQKKHNTTTKHNSTTKHKTTTKKN